MTLPQFPNVFYGSALLHGGTPAPAGMTVTAVISRFNADERHYALTITHQGLFGSGHGLKLKVGGDSDIPHLTVIEFFITDRPLEMETERSPAGHAHFYADANPHVTRIVLCQD
ncbi:MAG TPA: hypothetical protein VFR55_08410 [Dehalococcoidia bacterium]|nr:hypothetical protein [Dehalococcoidia bacterium]